MTIQHGVDGALGWDGDPGESAEQALAIQRLVLRWELQAVDERNVLSRRQWEAFNRLAKFFFSPTPRPGRGI